jgi:hypothetical protein
VRGLVERSQVTAPLRERAFGGTRKVYVAVGGYTALTFVALAAHGQAALAAWVLLALLIPFGFTGFVRGAGPRR